MISPLNESIQLAVGFYLILLLIFSLLANLIFLVVYVRSKEIRKNPVNIYIVAISDLNIIAAITLPFNIHSSFSGRYICPEFNIKKIGKFSLFSFLLDSSEF